MGPGTPIWYEAILSYPSPIDHFASRVRSTAAAHVAVKNCFISGSVVHYVQILADAMDTQLLEDATRRGRCSCQL